MNKLFLIRTLALFLSLYWAETYAQTMVQVNASNTNIQYSGRYDKTDPNKIVMTYPGVSIKAKFTGTAVDAVFKDYSLGGTQTTTYFYVIIDNGAPVKLKLLSSQTIYPLATGLAAGTHTVELFKITESSVGKCEFQGFRVAQGESLVTPDAKPSRRVEFIGNSQTCGYGNEVNLTAAQLATMGGFASANENNYKAWGAITARNLKAEYSCVAASGRGLYMNNSGTTTGTLPLLYDYTLPDQTALTWDHTRYIPDVIVINLGTNDFAAEAGGLATVNETTFKTTYVNFVNKLRGYYPSAKIVCSVGVMQSDWYPSGKQHWTRIQSYVSSLVTQINTAGDANVFYYKMEPQAEPYGEDWHPSAATHQAMATAMTNYIKTITGWTDTQAPQVAVSLNDTKIKYDGTWYSNVTASKVIFQRHSTTALASTETGYYGTWISQWVNTQTGIRIRFQTASPKIDLTFEKRTDGGQVLTDLNKGFNVYANGTEIMATNLLSFSITNPTPGTATTFEVSLPNLWSVNFTGMKVTEGYPLLDPGANTKPVYVSIGNSITHGTGQYCESSKTYPFLLAQTMGWNLHNLAVAGASVGWATALNLKGKQVDKISVLIGFNDFKFDAAALATKQTMYGRLLDSLRKFQPNAKIYCITPLASSATSGNAPYTLQDFRNMVKTQVTTRQQAGDSLLYLIDGPDISDVSMLASGDEVHLSEYGAKVLADNLAAFIDSSKVVTNPVDTSCVSVNYADNSSAWATYVDTYGSAASGFSTSNPITVKFTQVAMPSPSEYPWCTLNCSIGEALTDATSIKLMYQADQTVQVVLPQPPLDMSGESYMRQVAPSTGFTSISMPINTFAKPSWSSSTVALDLTKVTSIAFAPIFTSANQSGVANIKIQELVVYKAGCVLSTADDRLAETGSNFATALFLTPNVITLDVKESSDMLVSVYSIDGRLLDIQKLMLEKGIQQVELSSAINASGIYIIHLNDGLSNKSQLMKLNK